MLPLVSVIVPIYNVEAYLERCVNSIRNQTYQNLEIILVDDESSDRSGMMCDEFAEKDPRIKVIHKLNGGTSSARNEGLKTASGEYIAFADDDDYYAEEMISLLFEALTVNDSDMAICEFHNVDHELNFVSGESLPCGIMTNMQALRSNYASVNTYIWNKLYKRELWKGIWFPEGRNSEDDATTYKLIDRCKKISLVDQVLYYHVKRGESITGKPYGIVNLDGIEAFYEKYFYFRQKGTEYEDLADHTAYMFTNLYYESKCRFVPQDERGRKREKECDRMARRVCLDQFWKWPLPRRAKLLAPSAFKMLSRVRHSFVV